MNTGGGPGEPEAGSPHEDQAKPEADPSLAAGGGSEVRETPEIPASDPSDHAVADGGNVPEGGPPDLLPPTPSIVEPSPVGGGAASAPPEAPPLEIVEMTGLDWPAVRAAVDSSSIRGRMRGIVERMEALLDRSGGPGLLFDEHRADASDRVIRIPVLDPAIPLWIIGDLHGDWLALEAALAAIRAEAPSPGEARPRIVFLGDLFDDEGFGLEVLLRVFELIADAPASVCVIAGNHDEALSYDGVRFASGVTPSDFADVLNANLAHEWIERTGKLAVRLFAAAPRALFLPDGLLVAHGGFPLVDLHPRLAETGDWNDPACLSDFVWTRAHPKARRKLPNRFTRGSQFGYEDFAAFCALSTDLGRPVARMVRGHDHVEERYAVFPAYRAHPLLTTVALSRRLSRESFGPYERIPTIARHVDGALPRVYRLHIPPDMIREVFPDSQLRNLAEEPIQETQR